MKNLKSFILVLLAFFFIFILNCPEPDPDSQKSLKPVIYLYPTQKQKITVRLNYNGKLLFSYPEYNKGWDVLADPNGKIINSADNKEYSYLFWEGESKKAEWDLTKGFVVKGKDTIPFLQKTLSDIGLNPKEYNEFIVYWYPRMAKNKLNLVHFAFEEYNDLAKLYISPKPDTMLRVFMVFKPLKKDIKIEEQKFKKVDRKGFTLVEWGGTEL